MVVSIAGLGYLTHSASGFSLFAPLDVAGWFLLSALLLILSGIKPGNVGFSLYLLWRFFLLRGSCHQHSGTGPSFYGFLGSHFSHLFLRLPWGWSFFLSYLFLTLERFSLVLFGLLPGGLSCAPETWVLEFGGRCLASWASPLTHFRGAIKLIRRRVSEAWCPLYLPLTLERLSLLLCGLQPGGLISVPKSWAFELWGRCLPTWASPLFHSRSESQPIFCRVSEAWCLLFCLGRCLWYLISLCSLWGFVLESSGTWLPLVLYYSWCSLPGSWFCSLSVFSSLFQPPILPVNNLQGVEGSRCYNLETAILAVFFIFSSGFSLAPQLGQSVTHLRKTLCHSLFNMTSGLFADALFSDSAFLDYAPFDDGTYSVTCLSQLTYILDFGQFAQLSGALFWDSGLSLALWARPYSLSDNSLAVRFDSFAKVALCKSYFNLPLSSTPLLSLPESIRLAFGPGFSSALELCFGANLPQCSADSRVSGILGSLICVRRAPYPSTLAFQNSVPAFFLEAEGSCFLMLNLCETPAPGPGIHPLIFLTESADHVWGRLGLDVGFLGTAKNPGIPAPGLQLGAWLYQDLAVLRPPGALSAPVLGSRTATQRLQRGRLDLACLLDSVAPRPSGTHGAPAIGSRAALVAPPPVPMALPGLALCGDSVVDLRALGTFGSLPCAGRQPHSARKSQGQAAALDSGAEGGSPLLNFTQDGERRHGFLLVDLPFASQSVLGPQPGTVLTPLSGPLCVEAGTGDGLLRQRRWEIQGAFAGD